MSEISPNMWLAILVCSCILAFGFLFGKLPKIPKQYHFLFRVIGGCWLVVAAFLIAAS